MTDGMVLWLAGAIVAGIVWAVRQEGRLNGHDQELSDHAKRHDEMREDLSYIRQRIDSALNGKH